MTAIRKISKPDYLRRIWDSVFTSDDPFGWPFRSNIHEPLVFHPTDGYHLSVEQYAAVLRAAKTIGDSEFIVSITEGEGDVIERGEHWACKCPAYSDYLGLPLVLENSVYSPTSRWGLMVSHEQHAVVGGSVTFIKIVRNVYPSWRDDLRELKETWKANPNSGWLDDLEMGNLGRS